MGSVFSAICHCNIISLKHRFQMPADKMQSHTFTPTSGKPDELNIWTRYILAYLDSLKLSYLFIGYRYQMHSWIICSIMGCVLLKIMIMVLTGKYYYPHAFNFSWANRTQPLKVDITYKASFSILQLKFYCKKHHIGKLLNLGRIPYCIKSWLSMCPGHRSLHIQYIPRNMHTVFALLWLYIDWFSHIHQAYFTGTVAI